MPRAVRFDDYGGPEVLHLVDVPQPQPGSGEVVVRVRTAGVNPGEDAIRSGAMKQMYPAHFPEGQGSDLAGVVSAVGDGVTSIAVGDEVIGFSDDRNGQADFAVLPAERVTRKPREVSWDAASTLYVAGTTAVALMRATKPRTGETVVVSGAAGGVGGFATQLAVLAGARVLAVAGKDNHDALRAWGAEPIAYGDQLAEELRDAAPDGIAAMLDTHGDGYVDLAVQLGVPLDRIDTIADFEAAGRHQVKTDGMAAVKDPKEAIDELAALVADGAVEVPIKARFDLDDVQDAYRAVAERSGLGKIVLVVSRD